MSWLDPLKELNEIDLANLDLENVGSWPAAARALLVVLLFIVLVLGGLLLSRRRLVGSFAGNGGRGAGFASTI